MFVRVEPQHAGKNALGILVPPGSKTLVIVRPRALEWDLLPARWDGESDRPPQFCVFTRDEAAGVARRFVKALESAVERSVNPLESFGNAQNESSQLWLRTDEFVWIVCRRAQGKAYQPMVFAQAMDAASAAERLASYVYPADDIKQEYYFNTQNFS